MEGDIDSIAEGNEALPVPEWKREELRHRKERFLQHPESGRSWEEVKRRAHAQHENDPRFQARIAQARESIKSGKGVRLENLAFDDSNRNA